MTHTTAHSSTFTLQQLLTLPGSTELIASNQLELDAPGDNPVDDRLNLPLTDLENYFAEGELGLSFFGIRLLDAAANADLHRSFHEIPLPPPELEPHRIWTAEVPGDLSFDFVTAVVKRYLDLIDCQDRDDDGSRWENYEAQEPEISYAAILYERFTRLTRGADDGTFDYCGGYVLIAAKFLANAIKSGTSAF